MRHINFTKLADPCEFEAWDPKTRVPRFELVSLAERLGFEPRGPVSQANSLAVNCFQPLSHLSKFSVYCFRKIVPLNSPKLSKRILGEFMKRDDISGHSTAFLLKEFAQQRPAFFV